MKLAGSWREAGIRVVLIGVGLFLLTFDAWLYNLRESLVLQRSETRLESREAARVLIADTADAVLDMHLRQVAADGVGASARDDAARQIRVQLDALSRDLPPLLDGEAKLVSEFSAASLAWASQKPPARENALSLRDQLVGLLIALHLELENRSVAEFGELAPLYRLRRYLIQMHRATDDELAFAAGLDPAGDTTHTAERRGATRADRRTQSEFLLQAAGGIDDATTANVQHFLDSYRSRIDTLAATGRADRRAALTATAATVDADLAALATANQQRIADRLLAKRQYHGARLGEAGFLALLHAAAVVALLFLLFRYALRPATSLRTALSGADGHFVDWNVETRAVDFPPEFDVMLGFAGGEIPRTVDGLRWLYHPEDAPALEAAHRAAYLGRTDRVDAEVRMRRKGGGWLWINIRASVVERRTDGRARRIIGVVFDTNRRHAAEAELRQLRAEEEAIFNNSPVALMIVNERIIRRVNAATASLFGRPAEDMLGSTTRLLFPDDATFEHVGRHVYGTLRTAPSHVYETTFQRGDGGSFLARVHARLLDPGRPDAGYVFAIVEAGSDRRAVQALETGLAGQRELFAALPAGVVVVRDRVIVDCNAFYAGLMGYTPVDLIGQNSRVVYPDPSQWRQYGDRVYDALRETGRYNGRTVLRHADGRSIEVCIAGTWLAPENPARGAVFVVTPPPAASPVPAPRPTAGRPP